MKTSVKMTASRLKLQYEHYVNGHFFTRNNMKFSGDTMSNFYVRAKPVEITAIDGNVHTCWELTRIKPVKGGNYGIFFFDTTTFEQVRITQ